VELWRNSPHAWGTKDLGTDLIALHRDGGLWSIQAKAYDPKYWIKKKDLDSWLADSGRHGVTYRLLVATTDLVGPNAELAIDGQAIKVGTRLRSELEKAAITWPKSLTDLRAPKLKPKSPRPHQIKAVRDVVKGFKNTDRGQLISATGTGKTLTALFIKEKLKANRVLVLEPSIGLIGQNLAEFMANKRADFGPIVVASDVTEEDDIPVSDLGLPVTTKPSEIAARLREPGPVTMFSTLHSSPQIAKAFRRRNVPAFDLIIVDEAHHLALQVDKKFATALDNSKIPAKRRLFMTATQKTFNPKNVLEPALEAGAELASMDDEAKFGPVFHELTFGQAIAGRMLCDYQILIIGVTRDDPDLRTVIIKEAKRGRFVTLDGAQVKTGELANLRTVGGQIALIRAMKQHRLHRVAAFHSLVKRSRYWADSLRDVNAWMPPRQRIPNLTVAHLSSTNSSLERLRALRMLRSADADSYAVVSNVRLFGEGIDVPNLNAVAIIDPKGSEIDIIQTIGRVLRRDPDDSDKVGTILLPVFVDHHDIDTVSAIASSLYEPVHRILMVLRNQDERFAEEIDSVRLQLGEQTGGYRTSVGLSHIKSIDIPNVSRDLLQAFEGRIVERLYTSFSFWVQLVEEYKAEFGDTNIPTRSDGDVFLYKGHALGNVTNIFRTWAKNGKLSEERIAELNKVGFQWAPFDDQWEDRLHRTVSYFTKYRKLPTKGEEGRWLQRQRKNKNLDANRRARLDRNIPGWQLSARSASWEDHRQEVMKFVLKDRKANIGQDHPPVNGLNIGSWISTQRMNKRKGILSTERIRLLLEIPGWTWDTQHAKWMEMFQRLEALEQKFGTTSIPRGYPDTKLRSWTVVQRKRRRNRVLEEDRIRHLEGLETWEWEPKGRGAKSV
jgi:superfamily II DNA or RNA helicase